MAIAQRIVITGGTRGLGRALAAEFLARGQRVFITGRSEESVGRALAELRAGGGGDRVGGTAADSGSFEELQRAAAEARAFLGGIDHWIGNAGVNQASGRLLDLPAAELDRVLRTDLLGPMYGGLAARAALEESGGFLWFMEGHGSDGRIIDGLSLYGTAKRGVDYLWKALAAECRGSRMKVGALSPGIMVTDFILEGLAAAGEERRKKDEKVYDILADRPETVAAFFAPRILAARRNGERIAWLTPAKAAFRFLTAGIARRKVLEPADGAS